MAESTNDKNIIEELRSITERVDMNQYLKSSLGGYTKSSVLEYLSVLRKQQQATAENFSKNQQTLLDEKDRLRKSNDALRMRLNQIESEYHSLSETMRIHDLEDREYSVADIAALKGDIAALEKMLREKELEISRLQQKIEQLDNTVQEAALKIDQAGQEKKAMNKTLKVELLESQKLRVTISQLCGTVEEKNEEIAFLKAKISEGQLAILSQKVGDLTQQLAMQTEVLAQSEVGNRSKTKSIEALTAENDAHKQNIALLVKNVEGVNLQNEKLALTNKALLEQLETEYQKILQLIQERSGVISEKLGVSRSLDEANSKIELLELELKKYSAAAEREAAVTRADQAQPDLSSDID